MLTDRIRQNRLTFWDLILLVLHTTRVMNLLCSAGNTQDLFLASVLASGAAAAVVEASAGTDALHHMALADLGSGFPAVGETAVALLFAACVASGRAAALGVHVLQGTAQPAAVAVDGIHAAGHSVVLAELGKQQAAALLGIPVVENAPDKTAVIASGAR